MEFIFSMPGGGEWIIIIILGSFFIASPILAIIYYSKCKALKKENEILRIERDEYLKKLLDKS